MRKVPLIYVTETDMIDTDMVEKVGQGFVNSPARANGSRNLGPIPMAIVFTIHVSRQEHRIHSVHFKCSISSQNCSYWEGGDGEEAFQTSYQAPYVMRY